jgi:hypothetical protein
MPVGQIIRAGDVEVGFSNAVTRLKGCVVNAPHREETHEKLGWIIQDSAEAVYSLGSDSYIKKLS